MLIFDYIFRSVFFGFVVWTLIWLFLRKSSRSVARAEIYDSAEARVVQLFGIIHVVFLIVKYVELYFSHPESLTADRFFGRYWFVFWIYPVTYFGLTQLFWSVRLRRSAFLRIAIALWIFVVLYFERYVILITTMDRSYLPAPETTMYQILLGIFIEWIIQCIIAGFILILAVKIRKALFGEK